jgi:hypothetical protein
MAYLKVIHKALWAIPCLMVTLLVGCQSQTMTATEKTYLMRSSALQEYGVNLKKEEFTKYEKFSKTGYYDSTYDLDYEFKTPEGSSWPLYINQSLSTHNSAGDALTAITTLRTGTIVGMKTQGLNEKPMPNEKIYGDGSKLTILVDGKGTQLGNVFSARKGKRSYYLVLSGIYFDSAIDWEEFAGANIKNWLDKKTE